MCLGNKRRAEYLRNPETVCQPDPRNRVFGIPPHGAPYDGKPLEDHHRSIAAITLHEGVPEEIVIQFETAKNIYLYAWFVYRFYPVAQAHAYFCLELALKKRFEDEMVASGRKRRKHGFGLSEYLGYAIERGHIRNEDFEVWRNTTWVRARQRHLYESLSEMKRLGRDRTDAEEPKIEITEEDRAHDYVARLLESIPFLRNHFAHGSTSLHNQVRGTFQVVSEIMNKLWAPIPESSGSSLASPEGV